MRYRIKRVAEMSPSGELLRGPYEFNSNVSLLVRVSEKLFVFDQLKLKVFDESIRSAKLFRDWMSSSRLTLERTPSSRQHNRGKSLESPEYPLVLKDDRDETLIVLILRDEFPGIPIRA